MHDSKSSAAQEEKTERDAKAHNTEHKPIIEDKLWMIRQCSEYRKEYNICKKMKSRLYRLYRDDYDVRCLDWKDDFDYCEWYKKAAGEEYARLLIDHELQRMRKRLTAAKDNDVWEYRRSPPEFWAQPINKVPTDFKDTSNVSYNNTMCTIL